MNFREEFNLSIRARCAVLYVTTREEERLLSVVKDCAAELENMRVVSWDFASGFDVGVAVGKGNPIAVLDFIAKEPADTPILYVLKDFHRFLEDNMVCRMVKNLAAQLKPQQKSILIVSPVYKVPEELTSSVSVLEFQLPTLPELREYITNITQNVVVDMDKEGFEQFVRAFQGLTISTVKTILSKALARSGKISLNDLQLVLEEKKQVIRKTQVLEFFNAEETMGSIGGMDVLKSWIVTRGMAFSEQAQQFGLPYPKGVLIVGIQGTGKSLCAKAISQQWHMPLLRLDVGRLMGSYVGESEARTREMIQIAEAMAPCVLWIDEVDKGFAGIGGVQGDSGAQARVFGSLITWMQEKKSPVFIVATANNIEQLPPEFMRKGRFDEIFRPLLHGNTPQESHDFLLAFRVRFPLVHNLLKLLCQRIHGIVHSKTLCRILMIMIDYRLARQLAHAHDTVRVVHTVLFDTVDRGIHISTTPVEVRGMHMNHQWLPADLLGMDTRRIGQPIVCMNDVELLLPGYNSCHDGIIVDLLVQVVRIATGKLHAAQIIHIHI